MHLILFDASAGRHDHVNQMVLSEIADDLPHTAAYHVAGVREKDGALGLLSEFGITPLIGFIGQRSVVGESPVQLAITSSIQKLPFG